MSKSKLEVGSGVLTPADEKRAIRKSLLQKVEMPKPNLNPNYGMKSPDGEIDIEYRDTPLVGKTPDPDALDQYELELEDLQLIPEEKRTPEQVKRLDKLMDWKADNWKGAQPVPVY